MDSGNRTDLDRWLDHAAVVRTLDRYFRALDERRFEEDHFASIFLPDARVVRPNGAAVVGPADLVRSHTISFARFEATQHLLTGHDTDLGDDTAVVRANLVAIHLWKDKPAAAGMAERSFTAGGVVTSRLTRTPRRLADRRADEPYSLARRRLRLDAADALADQ